MTPIDDIIIKETMDWVKSFVIHYNICPFAKGPVNKGTVRVHVSTSIKKAQALEDLMTEVFLLQSTPSIETTLLVFPDSFKDFLTYLEYVDLAEQLLYEQGFEGIYQLASFHPDYYFEGTEFEDSSNYTNRSPYPMVHILREDSLDKAIAAYGDTSIITERNILTLQKLALQGLK